MRAGQPGVLQAVRDRFMRNGFEVVRVNLAGNAGAVREGSVAVAVWGGVPGDSLGRCPTKWGQ